MKIQISFFLIAMIAMVSPALSQTNWKLTKKQEGIAVYVGTATGSSFKSIKVECVMEGTYDRLLSVLSNVSQHRNWVYNNKSASLLKTVSLSEFYYYTETALPWPINNRDAVMHTTFNKDSLNRFLRVHSVADAGYSPERNGKVRVKRSQVTWYVTMPSANTIHVIYTLEADPGGNVPAWLVNSFVEKGPYESFKKLKALLKS